MKFAQILLFEHFFSFLTFFHISYIVGKLFWNLHGSKNSKP